MARKSRKEAFLQVEKTGALLATAAYVRLSLENGGREEEDTLETQLLLVEQFIREKKDLRLADVYVDNGFTGTEFNRPEFLRLMKDVRDGKIQCIVVKDLSRFGRDYLEMGGYLENIFPLLNVRFIAITDHYDSAREEDRLGVLTPVKNLVNAMYARDMSQKGKAYWELCRKAGTVRPNNAPYGYLFSEAQGRLVIDREVEVYVRMIFAWALKGVPLREIAYRLEFLGAPKASERKGGERKEGVLWKDYMVRSIVTNPTYAGFHVMGKYKKSVCGDEKREAVPRNEWLYFPGYHEAYLTLEDYCYLEERREAARKRKREGEEARKELREKYKDCFQGLIFCAECGRRIPLFRRQHRKEAGETYFAYYRCPYDGEERRGCTHKPIQQNFLKMVVMEEIRNLIRVACDKAEVRRELQKAYGGEAALRQGVRNAARLKRKAQRFEERLQRAWEEAGNFAQREKLLADKKTAEKKLEEQEEKNREMEKALWHFREWEERLEEYLAFPEFDEALIRELVKKIWVVQGRWVEIEFRCRDPFFKVQGQGLKGEGGKPL